MAVNAVQKSLKRLALSVVLKCKAMEEKLQLEIIDKQISLTYLERSKLSGDSPNKPSQMGRP